jgi:hypothetical protein
MDDDRIITEVVRGDGARPVEDSPEATIIERMRFSPAQLEAAALQANGGQPAPQAPRPVARRAPPLPGWVLPYLMACLTLLLVGVVVLWLQARVVGHF